jgi:hypothetical protein
MSRKIHYEKQFFDDTGFSETACGRVIARYDTHRGIEKLLGKIDCKHCLRKIKNRAFTEENKRWQ